MTLAIRLTLSWHQRQMLHYLAERNGEAEYNFGRLSIKADHMTEEEKTNMVKVCDQSVRDMESKLGVIILLPIFAGNVEKVMMRLTDAGRQVIEQMGLGIRAPQTVKFDLRTGAEIVGTDNNKPEGKK